MAKKAVSKRPAKKPARSATQRKRQKPTHRRKTMQTFEQTKKDDEARKVAAGKGANLDEKGNPTKPMSDEEAARQKSFAQRQPGANEGKGTENDRATGQTTSQSSPKEGRDMGPGRTELQRKHHEEGNFNQNPDPHAGQVNPNLPRDQHGNVSGVISKGGDPNVEAAEQARQDALGEPDPAIAMREQEAAAAKRRAENEAVNLPRDAEGKDQFGDQGNIPGADPGLTLAQQKLQTQRLREQAEDDERSRLKDAEERRK